MGNMFYYQTDIGRIGIAEQDGQLTNLYFATDNPPIGRYAINETDVLREANKQLQEYLHGQRKTFCLPLAPAGTEFMLRVWEALGTIPYGETRNYQEIAQSIGNYKAARAVGLANSKNPISIFIPCHRVIGANGKLTGYLGGLQIKQQLLELERQHGNI